jgi:hypothetical protein
MRARPSALAAVIAALAAGLAGCSTGVAEADRAIFVNACTGVTNATNPTCACAFDELGRNGSDQLINETIDSLQRGQAPPRLTRAIARCSTQN